MGQLDSRAFRKLHIASGERIRWIKAIPVPPGTPESTSKGVLFEEQAIAPAARFLVSRTTEDYESTQFGLIQKGTMQISAFPDWARFNHLDRIILIAPGRLQSQVSRIRRGATENDALPMPYAQSITEVRRAGVLISSANYEADSGGIKWLTGAPDEGVEYSVEYLWAPRYEVLPQSHKTSPTDRNGISLPLHYWLQREQNT